MHTDRPETKDNQTLWNIPQSLEEPTHKRKPNQKAPHKMRTQRRKQAILKTREHTKWYRQTDTQGERQTERQTDSRETDRQTDTDRQKTKSWFYNVLPKAGDAKCRFYIVFSKAEEAECWFHVESQQVAGAMFCHDWANTQDRSAIEPLGKQYVHNM